MHLYIYKKLYSPSMTQEINKAISSTFFNTDNTSVTTLEAAFLNSKFMNNIRIPLTSFSAAYRKKIGLKQNKLIQHCFFVGFTSFFICGYALRKMNTQHFLES